MKKIILICLFGLMFSQTEVTQRTIDFTIQGGYGATLADILPDYDLDWALINIVECPTQTCYLRNGIAGDSSKHYMTDSGNEIYAPHYASTHNSTFYVKSDNSIQFVFDNTGNDTTYTIKLLVTAEFPLEDELQGDMNDDNFLDVLDILAIVNIIVANPNNE